MIGADLAGLPAGDGDVALFDAAEDFLDVLLGIVLGLVGKAPALFASLPLPPRDAARMRQAPRESECLNNGRLALCLSMMFSSTIRDHAVLATLTRLGTPWQGRESIV
jgi:hypothetical protein